MPSHAVIYECAGISYTLLFPRVTEQLGRINRTTEKLAVQTERAEETENDNIYSYHFNPKR